jgi:hypothetical protein
MKAISIQQPWAWLIVNGYKDVENRSWPTKYRGTIAIHAGKKFDYDGHFWVLNNFPELEIPEVHTAYNRGGIVGVSSIIDCVTSYDSEWFFGKYGFVLSGSSPKPLIPLRGQLGIFEWRT